MVQEIPPQSTTSRASSRVAGERRIITVLFCDVAGSTALAEQFDREDWADIMNEAFGYFNDPVYRYGGTVARLMGDGILAFFGAPFAHEDDPERAVLAGLAIVDEMQPFRDQILREYSLDFNVRVGINTGPVVVGDVGSAQAGEYTAMGDAVNMAARMEHTAQPGTVQIGSDTYRLVAPLFDFEPLGGIEVKGKSAPVPAYRAIRPKEHPGSLRGIEGLHSPLIGRDEEFQKLRQAIEEVREGRGQIVFLTGDAGLGKSRLIEELRVEWDQIKGDESSLGHGSWTVSRGLSYESTRPYGLFMQRVREILGIEEDTPREMIQDSIAEAVASYPDDGHRETVTRAVESLLAIRSQSNGTGVDGEALKREMYEAVLQVWRQMAAQEAIVMVFDDLHWADPASVDLLIHLFQLVDDSPILYICAMRPERQSPGWKIKQAAESNYPHRYTEIGLTPLTSEESDALVDNLLHISDLPPYIHQLILEKTDGNPFFVEEVVRTLIDSGTIVQDEDGKHWHAVSDIGDIAIPDSLQALLLARIDRLEKNARYTLQLASVIGRTFYYHVLQVVSDAAAELDKHLNSLQQFDLIREAARVPELEYVFRHELTREAAYNSILRRRCRIFHRWVAEAMETLYADRLQEQAHRLAYHFHQAGSDEPALKYYAMAGDAAARMYANAEATMHYSSAIDIAGRIEVTNEQVTDLHINRGWALHAEGRFDEAIANYQALEELGKEKNDLHMELAALIPQATIYSTFTVRFDPEQAYSLSNRTLSLAQELKDPRAEARALWNLMLVEIYSISPPEKALAYGEKALAIARDHNLKSELAYILNDISRPYFGDDKVELGMAALEESRVMWRQLGNKPMLSDNLASSSSVVFQAGELDKAYELAYEALQISESISNFWGQGGSHFSLAPIYGERGEYAEAANALDWGSELSEKANFAAFPMFIQTLKGWIYGLSGDIEGAFELIEPALEASNEIFDARPIARAIAAHLYLLKGDLPGAAKAIEDLKEFVAFINEWEVFSGYARPYLVLVKEIMGEVALASQDFQEALTMTDDTLTKMSAVGMRVYTPELLGLKGRAFIGLGRTDEAREVLQEALSEAERQGSRRSLWTILFALSQLEQRLGNSTEAESLRKRAREVVEYIADHVGSPERREMFFKLPAIQEAMNG